MNPIILSLIFGFIVGFYIGYKIGIIMSLRHLGKAELKNRLGAIRGRNTK